MVNRKSFFKINTVKAVKKLLACSFMAGIVIINISVFGMKAAEGSWLFVANSNFFYASPTVVLEVKYTPPLVSASPADRADTVSGDEGQTAEESDDNDNTLDMAVSSDDQLPEEPAEGTEDTDPAEEDGEDSAVSVGHHNALIISRLLTEKHSLHTEIEVDNIASNDQIFIDVFSGDVFSPASSGDDQEEISEAADTVFISFENENGTVKSVRIGIDDEQGRGGIDNIVVLDGISEPATPASQDAHSSHIIDDSSFDFEQIKSPIVIILPNTEGTAGERIYFEDGRELKMHVFSKDYGIGEIKAVRDEVEIRLIEK